MDYETLTGTKSQARVDAEHLSLLTTLHSVMGGLTALFASLFIFHIVMGLMLVHNPAAFTPRPPSVPQPPGQPYPYPQTYPFFPPQMGYLFVTMGTAVVLGGWTLGALTAYAGRCIRDRKNYTFLLIVSALNCAFVMPLGAALGIFTFIVLLRPTVKAMFAAPTTPREECCS